MPVSDRQRTRQHEQRRRAAGLIRLARWVRREDLDAALAALAPFLDRAAVEPLHADRLPRPAKITGFVLGPELSGRENRALRELGLTFDRERGRWLVPDTARIPPDLLEDIGREAREVFRHDGKAR